MGQIEDGVLVSFLLLTRVGMFYKWRWVGIVIKKPFAAILECLTEDSIAEIFGNMF